VIDPLEEMMEPYLVHRSTSERGIPEMHEKLDCDKHFDDP